jgi:hypothetical protein
VSKFKISVLVIACFLSGCQTANTAKKMLDVSNSMVLQQVSPENVAILRGKEASKKPATKIAELGAHGNAYAKKDFLEDQLKQEAAKIGADFIYVSDVQISKDEKVAVYGDGILLADQVQRPHLYAYAYKYSKIKLGVDIDHKDGTIKYVNSGGAFDKAGIKEGYKILAFNGVYVGSEDARENELAKLNVGDKLIVECLNEKQEKVKFEVTPQPNL